eukprot:m.20338 g.20338  ORF g.20338 m.20338 type:complete len:435 (-) comp31927_c0_seq1:151-1455(-)
MTFTLNTDRFLALLEKLIGESQWLQNLPPTLIPQEDKAIAHLLPLLEPYSQPGGPLKVQHIAFAPGRGNLIIEYASKPDLTKTVSFVGSHLDVVPADPKNWNVDPFKLTIKGDQLFGRGTTDCLGHVALITDLFLQLAETKPHLNVKVVAVFIASEENADIPNIGVDELLKHGYLKDLINGPVYWIDSADAHPCIGTAGVVQWKLTAKGKLGHSGFPHKSINAVDLAYAALGEIEKHFHTDFPAHPSEKEYSYGSSSSFKCTRMVQSTGALNQIPGYAELQGDIRLTPFYKFADVTAKLEQYVKHINENVSSLGSPNDMSKYEVVEEDGSTTRGSVELKYLIEPEGGIACSLTSNGYKALVKATEEVLGKVVPYSDCGSLPLVADLQEAGFDLQITGYGISDAYHADNEYCNLSDFQKAMVILHKVVLDINASA